MNGKVSYGDIELSADDNTLFAMNMGDGKIYKIPVNATASSPAIGTITASALPIPSAISCGAGTMRPLGLANGPDGKLYVSAVCESAGIIYVWGYNPTTDTWDSSPIIDYTIVSNGKISEWTAWSATPTYKGQALAMGFDFDPSGKFLSLTYISRYPFTVPSSAIRNTGNIVRFCNNGTNWVVENNGDACGVIGDGVGNAQGPGGGEFYNDSSAEGNEVSIIGAAVQIPGRTNLVVTLDDPIDLYTSGVAYLNTNNGSQSGRYEVLPSVFAYPPPADEFDGKRINLGDIEYMGQIAPIEIGNRVWTDTDHDGLQDPDENGIDGVVLELWQGNIQVGATTTANGGQYYFNATNVTLNGANSILSNTTYQIRLPNVAGGSKQSVLGTNLLTIANQGTNDLLDSDAALVGNIAIISLITGNIGENNHSFDIGFMPPCVLSASTTFTNPTCPNNDGTVTLTVTNGSGAQTYLWSNGATTQNLTTLGAGDYTVTVTDGACSVTATASLDKKNMNTVYEMCPGNTFDLTIPDNTLTNIKWQKDGSEIVGQTGLTYTATAVGVYTYTSNNVGGCAVGQCCAIEIKASASCCKLNVCLPVIIARKN
jgi:hypothetical protein